MKKSVFLCLFVVGISPLGAMADTVFFGEDLGLGEGTPLPAWPNADAANVSFLSFLVGVSVESFEGYPDGTVLPGPIVFGTTTATISAPPAAYQPVVDVVPTGQTNGVGRYATDGTHYLETSSNFTITFSVAQVAFGFFGVDVGDFQGQLTLTTTTGLRSV